MQLSCRTVRRGTRRDVIHIAPPALSTQTTNLESGLGVMFFTGMAAA